MTRDYLKIKFLDEEQLNLISNFLDKSIDSDWDSGLKTFCGIPQTKNNKELQESFVKAHICSIIEKSLVDNLEYNEFCHPKKLNSLLISKTEEGGYYHTHIDHGLLGHYSATIFLSDPSTYEGGELSLYINDEEKKFKLERGYGLIYSTGIPHKVNTVTSGTRYAAALWVKSKFSDPFIRELYSDIRSLKIEHEFIVPHPEMEDVMSQTSFKLCEIINKILRRYAD